MGLTLFCQFIFSCQQRNEQDISKGKDVDSVEIQDQNTKQKYIDWPDPKSVDEFFKLYALEHDNHRVLLKTRSGEIEIELFSDTPLHRASFLFNISRGLYDKTIFYRVVPEFMIQGGNSDNDKTIQAREQAGAYYIQSETNSNQIHGRGADAMAMSYENNPEMKSTQYSFYIVIGQPFTEKGLAVTEDEYDMKVPQENRKTYITIDGAPHLDGKHTVFGKVVRGMEVVESTADEKRDSGDRPVDDEVVEYEVLKKTN